MPSANVLDVDFQLGGNSAAYCGEGWLAPEVGHRWSFGQLSELHFRDLPPRAAYALVLTAAPFGGPQRIVFVADGKGISEVNVERMGTFGCVVPGDLLSSGDGLKIGLWQPDGRSARDVLQVPDDRPLGIAAIRMQIIGLDWAAARTSETEIPLKDLMLCFENLGDNCEFGIVQRRCGAEPLGLFRFCATQLKGLIEGIGEGFVGMAERDNLLLKPNQSAKGRREYLLHQTKYKLIYHTFVFEDQMAFETLITREQRKLAFLHAKFMEDLKDAAKIFVLKRNSALPESAIVPLWEALRTHGRHTLLWVVPADASHPNGTIEVKRDGLLKGYLGRFAPYEDATDVSTENWIELCRNAVEARQSMNASEPAERPAVSPVRALG